MRERIIERLKEASRLSRARRGALARSQGAARRHRHLDHRRVLPVAAARVSARGRRRSRVRPGGRHRGAAAGRRVARSGAPHLPRHRARRRRRRAGVRAARRAAPARRDWRRCSIGGWSRRMRCGAILQKGPRDLTAAVACRRRRGAAARRLRRACRGGLDGVPRRRPVASSAVCDAGGRHARCWRAGRRRLATSQAPRRAGGISRADRSAARLFPDPGRPAARRALRRHRLHRRATATADDAWKRHRAAAAHDRAGGRRRDPRVPARSERRHVARRLADLRRGARRSISSTLEAHALLDFSGVLERAVQLLKEMDEFAREPATARGALPPRAGRRVPGHEPRAVGAGARSWCGAGAKGSAPRPTRCRRRSSSSATASSRFTASATRTSRSSTKRRASSARCGRTAMPRQAITVSFRSAPALLAFVNDVFAAIVAAEAAGTRSGATRSGTATAIDFPTRRRRRRRRRSGLKRGPTTDEARSSFIAGDTVQTTPERVADEIVRLLAAATVRDRTTGVRRAARAGRRRHPVPLARQPPRVRGGARAARRVRPTSTRGWASSTPTRSRTRSRCCGTSPIRLSQICAPAAFLRSRLVRLSDDARGAAWPQARRGDRCVRAAGRWTRRCSADEDRTRARRASARGAAMAVVGRSPRAVRAARRGAARDARTPSSSAGRAACRRART